METQVVAARPQTGPFVTIVELTTNRVRLAHT
jgi:hypothetical protein